MPRLTQSEIHSDFSTASGTWTGYRAEVTGFYNDYPNSELDAHISKEYNRKISNLGQDDSLYLHPYDAGFGYRGDGYNFFDILGNAAAAYSLRSINPTKDPNVVKVRRSSDNSTKDFKASEIGTTLTDWVGAGNDGHVTTWYDQGTNGNNATQTTSSAQPKIVDAGTLVTEGGQAALDFDGTDDYFQLTSNVFAEQLEVAVVNHLDEYATNFQRLINLSNGSDDDFMIVKAPTNQVNALLLRCQSTQGVNTAPNFGNNLINDQNLIYATSNTSSDSYTVSTDGVSQVSSGTISLGAGNFTKSTIGVRSDLTSTTFVIGNIQEIVIFTNNQSANKVQMENSIMNYYNIS